MPRPNRALRPTLEGMTPLLLTSSLMYADGRPAPTPPPCPDPTDPLPLPGGPTVPAVDGTPMPAPCPDPTDLPPFPGGPTVPA